MPDPGRAEKNDGPSPARLYATLIGGLLVLAGIVGFFYSASFGGPGEVADGLGIFSLNAWNNVILIATGTAGLLLAGYAARQYSFWLGTFYLAVAIWGFMIGGGEAILGFLPVNAADDLLHLALGVLGVLAALATPRRAMA